MALIHKCPHPCDLSYLSLSSKMYLRLCLKLNVGFMLFLVNRNGVKFVYLMPGHIKFYKQAYYIYCLLYC